MCGISGFYDSRLSPEGAQALMQEMLQSMHHRGPDGSGIYRDGALTLGHNRLSIIDLSETGAQPMEKESLIITFNGEVYNFLEIKEALTQTGVRFRGSSDTEVILEAYRKWGPDCVKQFVGMWAFAIWDPAKRTLFCSRDRFGIKPFNYIFRDGAFYFASEFRALKHSRVFSSDLNLYQVARGLQLGWTGHGEETYFSCIYQLPAAHNLIFQEGKITLSRYWELDPSKEAKGSFQDRKEEFKSLFDRSLRQHMRSDVEVGGCLSGGLDSSAIASLSATLFPGKDFKTFTIYYSGQGEVDERPFAEEVVKKYPRIRPHYFEPRDQDVAENWTAFAQCQEVPPPGSSPFSQFFVMRLAAAQKMKVLLDGQGSDEFLAGYHHSFFRIYSGWMKKLRLLKVLNDLRERRKMHGLSRKEATTVFMKSAVTLFSPEQNVLNLEYRRKFPFLIPEADKPEALRVPLFSNDRLRDFSYNLLFHTTLPSLLHFEDRNSMHFSIESRVPFLDHRLVEFGFSLPEEDKVRNTWTKYILREAMGGVLPDAIRMRKDKKGFVTPGEKKWLAGPLRHLLNFDPGKIAFLDAPKARNELSRYKSGDTRNAALVWRLASLNDWLNA